VRQAAGNSVGRIPEIRIKNTRHGELRCRGRAKSTIFLVVNSKTKDRFKVVKQRKSAGLPKNQIKFE